MPGTGDVIYVLGPSLVAVLVGVVILVAVRALRRGPAIAPRSAPDHELLRPAAEASDSTSPMSNAVPAQRSAEDWDTVTRGSDGERLAVRPSDSVRDRAVARRTLSRR